MVKVPKPKIKPKEGINIKNIHAILEGNLTEQEQRLKIIETEITKAELEKRTKKEQTSHLKEKLKELKREENKIKFEESEFKNKIDEASIEEQISERKKLKLEKQKQRLRKKVLSINQTIERQLLE